MGVLYDNLGKYGKAIEQYRKFLSVSKSTQDALGQALAYNSLGLDHMLLACPSQQGTLVKPILAFGAESLSCPTHHALLTHINKTPPLPHTGSNVDSGKHPSEDAQQHLEKAVDYHTEHLQQNDADEGGQFVAHTNMGICASELRDFNAAMGHHEAALKIAVDLQSPNAQCIAIGNLGLLAIRQGDTKTAEACLGQHLQLTRGKVEDPSKQASFVSV